MIFDFNGVVADDETPHLHCFQQALAEQGFLLSREDYYGTYLGMDERTCTAALLLKRNGACDPMLHARIIERKATLFRDYTALHRPALFPWVLEFIQRTAGLYRLAIASGGRREHILSALEASATEKAFELIVSADECPVGKPDPAIYEFTLRQLNARLPRPPLLRADECLVIEDSRAGVLAGLTAGMRVLAVATTYPASQLSNAHLVLPNLERITPAELACRLSWLPSHAPQREETTNPA
ncbi:MAG: HAD family phosphatase [Nitrospira defluvii]|nr:HAD family phosphatase [Nitrospira defluvii]